MNFRIVSLDGIGNIGESDGLSVDSKIIEHFSHITPGSFVGVG
jgi:hypothetical protein